MYATRAMYHIPVGLDQPVIGTRATDVPSVSSSSHSSSATLLSKTSSSQEMNKRYASSGFMSKIFSKKEKDVKGVSNEVMQRKYELMAQKEKREGELKGLVQPCSFIRPLQNKPEARVEARPFGANSARTKTILAKTAAHRSQLSDTVHGSDTQPTTLSHTTDSECGHTLEDGSTADVSVTRGDRNYQDDQDDHYYPEEHNELRAVHRSIADQIDYAASLATQDPGLFEHWNSWLGNYATGKFNLNHLPDSPLLSTRFRYLPSIFPPNEPMRLDLSASYEPAWNSWGEEKASACINSAMEDLDTQFASISCFDKEFERLRVVTREDPGEIKREISLGAHALLTTDALVVLDTHLDWRFQDNPLVNGELDRIRFFAAIPLLSPEEVAIGVLAVFDYSPRDSFNTNHRTKLSHLGQSIMADLDHIASGLQATYAMQQESRIDDEARSVLNYSLLPSALRVPELKTPPSATSGSFTDFPSQGYFSSYQETTPPSSANSENNTALIDSQHDPLGLRRLNKKLTVDPDFDHVVSPYDIVTPDSDDYRSCSPRPWSSSDITSLHPHPPNTPAFSLQEEFEEANFDISVEDFMALHDDDCAEEVYPEPRNPSITNNLQSELSPAEQPEDLQIMDVDPLRPLLGYSPKDVKIQSRIPVPKSVYLPLPGLPPLPKLPPQARSPSTNSPFTSRCSGDSMAEENRVAFVCQNIAQSLGYNLLYAVELAPTKPMMTDEELFKPGGLRMQIIAAHGMHEPLDLDPKQHIKALRSRGCVTWEDSVFTESAYDHGRLVTIHAADGGPHRLRKSGIIVGAFGRQDSNDVLQEVGETAHLRRFEEEVQSLKPLLLKSKNRIPQGAKNESQKSPRYPANEAKEIGDSFQSQNLDAKAPSAPRFTRFGYNKAR